MSVTVAIVGNAGDKRFDFLYELLRRDESLAVRQLGKNSKTMGDCINGADVVIGGIPLQKDFADAFVAELKGAREQSHKQTVFVAGVIPENIAEELCEAGIRVADIVKRDDFAILNAIPTAEGMAQYLMANTDFVLSGTPVMVLGAGRVGKVAAYKLRQLGASVTVSARKGSDHAFLRAFDFKSCGYGSDLLKALGETAIVVNTVPEKILCDEAVVSIRNEALIIDLSSGEKFQDGIRRVLPDREIIRLPGLPGKVAPLSAATYIKDVIMNIIAEAEGGV